MIQASAKALGLVAEPAWPALHGEAVLEREVLRVEIDRQAEERVGEEIEQKEDVALRPAIAADVHGGVAHPGDDAEAQQKKEADDAPGLIAEVQDFVHRAEMLRLGEVGGRERVVGELPWGGAAASSCAA